MNKKTQRTANEAVAANLTNIKGRKVVEHVGLVAPRVAVGLSPQAVDRSGDGGSGVGSAVIVSVEGVAFMGRTRGKDHEPVLVSSHEFHRTSGCKGVARKAEAGKV